MAGVRYLTFILMLWLTGTAAAGPGWRSSFEEARAVAARDQVPLLIHFHAPWCGPCQQMDRDVFSSLAVKRALAEGLAAVKVDTSERPDVSRRYGVSTVPRDVVVYPDGRSETLSVGYIPRSAYLSMLRDVASRGRMMVLERQEAEEAEENRDVARPLPDSWSRAENAGDEETGSDTAEAPETAAAPGGRDDDDDESEGEIIGLGGYCPVLLSDRRQWVRGRPELTERWRGVLYRFSGPQQRDRFLKNPDRYAPRNLGCDPVVLLREQRAVTGRIRYGLFFDGGLYLFRTAENREEFRRRPLKYTRIQHAVKPHELSGQTYR